MNPFHRPSVRYGKTPAPETPYQKAAQVWDERIGSARVQARNWRLIAFGNLALAAGLAGGLVLHPMRGTALAWVERHYENGSLASTERWTAIVTIVIETPRDADRLRRNPLGVFVHALNWSKELG